MKFPTSGFKRIALVLLGLLMASILIEGSLRATRILLDIHKGRRIARLSENNNLGYELKPNYAHRNISTNSYGFRGKEFDRKKHEGAYRIVGIGDSITFGIYLEEKDTFLSLLERRLNQTGVLRDKVEVVNAGVGGYNIWQYLEVYKNKVHQLDPDMIFISICQNDFSKSGPYYTDFWGMVRGDLEDRSGRFQDHFLTCQFIVPRLKIIRDKLFKSHRDDDPIRAVAPRLSDNWQEGVGPLSDLIARLNAHQVKYTFLIFPYKHQLKSSDRHSDETLTEYFENNQIAYIDFINVFRSHKEDLYIEGDYIHPNKVGNIIISTELYEYLTNKSVAPTS